MCVEVQPEARILLRSEDGSDAVTEEVLLEDLSKGLQGDTYGELEPGGCLLAETLIALAE